MNYATLYIEGKLRSDWLCRTKTFRGDYFGYIGLYGVVIARSVGLVVNIQFRQLIRLQGKESTVVLKSAHRQFENNECNFFSTYNAYIAQFPINRSQVHVVSAHSTIHL